MKNEIIYYNKIWKNMFSNDEAIEVGEHIEERKDVTQNLLDLCLHKFKGLCSPNGYSENFRPFSCQE